MRRIQGKFHIDLFVKIVVKKGIINIKLVERPFFNGGYGEKKMNRNEFSHWGKSIMVIDSFNLSVPFCD